MGLLGKVFQSVADVVVAPVDFAKDVVTLAGVTTGQEEAYTVQRARKLARHLNEVYEEMSDL